MDSLNNVKTLKDVAMYSFYPYNVFIRNKVALPSGKHENMYN